MVALEIALVDWFLTWVLSPEPSARTQPVTVTSPAGGSGRSPRSRPLGSVSSQPRSTSRAEPSAVTRGTTTSTPETPSRVR